MIGIILLILKIILWLILGVLGLILALLLLVLFVPIRYKVFFEKFDQMKGYGKVSYLLNLFRVYISYDEGVVSYKVKILFFTVFKEEIQEEPGIEAKVDDDSPDTTIDEEEILEEEIQEENQEIIQEEELSKEEVREEKHEEAIPKEHKIEKETSKETSKEIKKEKEVKQKNSSKKRSKKSKKKEKEEESFFDKIKRFYGFLKAYENQGLFKFVMGKIKAMIKSILPRKIEGMICYGFDDPSTTGYILAMVSPFYPYYHKNFELQPDFENPRLEGKVKARGRIIIGVIVYYAIRIILDKRVRRLIKEARK